MRLTLIFDGLLAMLLLATLVYVARLNHRLGQLRNARQEFEALIARFSQATEQADRSLAGVKEAAAVEGQNLQATIDRGRGLREDLAFLVDKANGLADQLEATIARARKGADRPRPAAEERPAKASRRPPAEASAEAPGKTMSAGERDLLKTLASVR